MPEIAFVEERQYTMNPIVNLRGSPSFDWERECTSPSSNLFSHVIDLGNFTASNLSLEVLELIVTLRKSTLNFLADLDALINIASYTVEILGAETATGHGWCTYTDTARCKS